MKINYCLPVIKNTKEEVLQIIQQNLNDYDFFEVWLDYIQDLDQAFIDFLINQYEEKLILLFRRQNLEDVKMDADLRQKLIWQVASSKALIDLDVFNQAQELNYIKERNIRPNLIISCHNYTETPTLEELKKIVENMEEFNPNIYKVACFCNSDEDALKLLNLLMELKQKNLKFIVLGMGAEGLVTRIVGSLWGNEIAFAPKTLEEKSAEGQLTKSDLVELFKIMGISS